MTRDEFRGWAAGAGRALAEFSAQLTRAKITRSGGEAIGSWASNATLGKSPNRNSQNTSLTGTY
jgi:hypothetical protein